MVLAQTLDDFELIVCDDGSTDGTPVVMTEWVARDPRIHYVRQPCNLGGGLRTYVAGSPSRRRNWSPSSMTATFTTPACSNDGWRRYAPVPRRRLPSTRTTGWTQTAGSRRRYRERLDSCVPGRVLLERLYFRRWHFTSPVWGTFMFRRSKYFAAGGHNTGFSFHAYVDLYLRLAETNCVAYVPKPLIGLASRETVPKLFRPPPKRLARRVFREARARHYQGRPLRLGAEMLRHWTFAAVDAASVRY